VGLPGGTLTVYLAYDSDAVRREVTQIVKNVAPNLRISFLVSGTFQAQS
jgi:hypothetical protein